MLIFFIFKLPNFQLSNLSLKLFSGKFNKKVNSRQHKVYVRSTYAYWKYLYCVVLAELEDIVLGLDISRIVWVALLYQAVWAALFCRYLTVYATVLEFSVLCSFLEAKISMVVDNNILYKLVFMSLILERILVKQERVKTKTENLKKSILKIKRQTDIYQ